MHEAFINVLREVDVLLGPAMYVRPLLLSAVCRCVKIIFHRKSRVRRISVFWEKENFWNGAILGTLWGIEVFGRSRDKRGALAAVRRNVHGAVVDVFYEAEVLVGLERPVRSLLPSAVDGKIGSFFEKGVPRLPRSGS